MVVLVQEGCYLNFKNTLLTWAANSRASQLGATSLATAS